MKTFSIFIGVSFAQYDYGSYTSESYDSENYQSYDSESYSDSYYDSVDWKSDSKGSKIKLYSVDWNISKLEILTR